MLRIWQCCKACAETNQLHVAACAAVLDAKTRLIYQYTCTAQTYAINARVKKTRRNNAELAEHKHRKARADRKPSLHVAAVPAWLPHVTESG